MATMKTGLGGPAGYGENVFSTTTKVLGDNDDGAVAVDVTSVFGSGIALYGSSYSTLYINSNGAITFGSASSTYNTSGFGNFSGPTFAPFFSDIDITSGGEIYWDLDPANGKITVTWDSVAPFGGGGSANSFQVVLSDLGNGEIGVEYIYGDIQWASNGDIAGLTNGAGSDYALEFSGDGAGLQGYETNDFDAGDPAGTFTFQTVGGVPDVLIVSGGGGDESLGLGFVDALGNAISIGNDIVDAGGGNDTVDGDVGNDTIYGGAGDDLIQSGSDAGPGGPITWTPVSSGANLQGTSGQDFFQYNGGFGSNATIRFNSTAAAYDADHVPDYVHVTSTSNYVRLTIGDFQTGVDKIVLSDGYTVTSSSISGSQVDVTVTLNGGGKQYFTVYVDGPIDVNQMFTTTLPTTMDVWDDDVLYGGDGADRFMVEDAFGADTIFGGEGGTDSDTIDLSGLSTGVSVALGGDGAGTVAGGGDILIFSEIEALDLTSLADTVDASNDTTGLSISAGGGADSILGGQAGDTIAGGAGDDVLSGDFGDDTILGGDGDDILHGGGGQDSLSGEAGNDMILGDGLWVNPLDHASGPGGSTTDLTITNSAQSPIELWWIDQTGSLVHYQTIAPGVTFVQPTFNEHNWVLRDTDGTYLRLIEGAADQTIAYGNDELGDTIAGGAGDDVISGQFGNDSIDGGLGRDTIYGGDGDDVLDGFDQDDTLYGGAGNDVLFGGAGNDILKTGQGDDALFGGEGDDLLMNSAGDDTLTGGAGNDTLIASAGNDVLFGGDGEDTLMGGTGDDSLDGGAGNDVLMGDLAGVDFNATGTDGVGLAANITDFPATELSYEITFASVQDTSGDVILGSYITGGVGNDLTLLVRGNILRVELAGNAPFSSGVDVSGFFDGQPHTFGFTWDSATGAIEFYVDGSGIAGGTYAAGATLTTGGTFALGQEQDSLGGGFDTNQILEGTIYGARLYDDVRSPAEMLDSALGPYADTTDPNLIANWVADPGAATFTDTTGSYAMVMTGDVSATDSSGDDTVAGGTGNDTIYAGGGNDLLYGGDNSDTLDGGAGNDTLEGGAGADSLAGEGGIDTLSYASSSAGVTIDSKTSTASGGDATGDTFSGFEQYEGSAHADSFVGGAAEDTFYGMGGRDTLDGGDGADALFGGAGDDTSFGGAGNDVLYDVDGNDVLFGGAGDDTLDGAVNNTSRVSLYGGDGNDQITTYGGDADIFAGAGNDTVFDDAGDENIFGEEGDDEIWSWSGNDTVFGGGGNDTAYGGLSTDRIFGGAGNDTIAASGGDDSVEGGAGADSLDGGTGNDRLSYASAASGVALNIATGTGTLGDAAGDTVSGFEIYEGSAHTDTFEGGASNDTILGEAGNDSIYGGDGDDEIYGGLGNDTLGTGIGNDTLFGGEGDDVLTNSTGDDTLFGGTGNDTLTATAGNDSLYGGDGDDALFGGADNDLLDGGTGNDTLDGGSGNDAMYGGDDADSFLFGDGFGDDVVAGGEGGNDVDIIDLSGLTTSVTVTFTGDEAGTITDGAGNTITFSEIERIITTAQDDLVDATAQPTAGAWVDLREGDDTFIADTALASDQADTVFGGTGNDTITSGAGADYVEGGAGNDTIDAGDRGDTVYGGDGNDTITGGSGADTIFSGGGDDAVTFGEGDSIDGGDGDDTFFLADYAEPGAANVTIDGGGTGEDGGGDTLKLGTLADLSTLTITNTFTNASGNTSQDGMVTMDDGSTVTFTNMESVVCFATGTPILTPEGEVPVERLRPGDLVCTRDNGPMPLVWSGGRSLDAATLKARPNVRPILIRAGAFGVERSLIVSPQHGMLLRLDGDERMFRAAHLAQTRGGAVRVMQGCRSVTYVHLVFEGHQVIYAAGRPSESFFPGPLALCALNLKQQIELVHLFPDFRQVEEGGDGPWDPARAYVRRKELPEHLSALEAARA